MADIILLFTVIGVCAVRVKATMEVESNQEYGDQSQLSNL